MTNEKWSEWKPLGGGVMYTNYTVSTYDSPPPAFSSWGPNRIDVMAFGKDNSLWHKYWG
jgi:hypothetical protein